MTIPTPNQFKERKVVREEVSLPERVIVPESRLGDGKLDPEDVKKVYSFGKTYKPVLIAAFLFVTGVISGGGLTETVEYIDKNDPVKSVNVRIDGIEEQLEDIKATLDEIQNNKPIVLPTPDLEEFSMNFEDVPVGEDTEVPFTVVQDTTTDDGSSRITAKTSFSVQSTDK